MNEFSQVSSASVPSDRGRGLRYLAVGAAANAAFWGLALLLLRNAPRLYTSQWSLILPGGPTRSLVNQPSSSNSAGPDALTQTSQDIRATYRVIATTDEVRKAAAAKLGMTAGQFGAPQVRLVDGTTLMNFEIAGSTPEEAQKKAYALEEAFQDRLTQLRVQQVSEQEAGFENSLGVARKKLEAAQFRLSEYKVRSGLASKEQIDQLAASIEALRRQRSEMIAQQQDVSVRTRQLSTNLKTSSQLAADAFALKSDALFKQCEKNYSEATTRLNELSVQFGPNHPLIIQATAKQKAAEQALQNRGQDLLRRSVDVMTIARMNLGSMDQATNAKETLYKDVITNQTEQQGLIARVQELDRQLAQLEKRLGTLAQRSSTLDALNRDVQIAESIFSSTVANLDAGKVNIFGSYPSAQLAAEPNLPGNPVIPKRQPLLAAATVGSLVVTIGLCVLWLRKTPFSKRWLPQYNTPHKL